MFNTRICNNENECSLLNLNEIATAARKKDGKGKEDGSKMHTHKKLNWIKVAKQNEM